MKPILQFLAISSRSTAGWHYTICTSGTPTISSYTGYEWSTCSWRSTLYATKFWTISSYATTSTTMKHFKVLTANSSTIDILFRNYFKFRLIFQTYNDTMKLFLKMPFIHVYSLLSDFIYANFCQSIFHFGFPFTVKIGFHQKLCANSQNSKNEAR